jgi:uncharacterized SAM-binding protein YcdF (DUF218 family)
VKNQPGEEPARSSSQPAVIRPRDSASRAETLRRQDSHSDTGVDWHDRGPAVFAGERETTGGDVHTVLRYLGGAALVAALIVGGVVVRIQQVGGTDDRSTADAIVVLGAAQYDGQPSPVFQARLAHAAELFGQGVAPRILAIGGGRSGDRTTEGAAGVEYLANQGIDPGALITVGTGDDTLASLRAAEQLLTNNGWTSVVLVTDPWHSARAGLMATDLGLSVHLSPVPNGPATQSGVEARYIVREALGVLYYRLTGGSSGAGSAVL